MIVRDNQISFRPQLTFGSEWDRILVSVNTLLVCLLCNVGSQTKQERSKEARAVKISLLPSFTWHWQEKLLWRLLKYMFILPFLSLNKILKIIGLNHLLITKVDPFWNSIRLWIDCENYETKVRNEFYIWLKTVYRIQKNSFIWNYLNYNIISVQSLTYKAGQISLLIVMRRN